MDLSLLIQEALREDMPSGDLTTDSLGLESRLGRARLVAKEDLILSGQTAFENTVKTLDPELLIKWQFKEGELALKGQVICTLAGDMVNLLKAERTALNFLGRLSGIATYTRCFVNALEGTKTKILDTRKTTPGWRQLEKMAVRHGGGQNHRMNLSEAVLLKENHLTLGGGINSCVAKVRRQNHLPVEVEVKTLEEVKEAVACNVDRILLDNMNTEQLREALRLIPASIKTEASGNMTLERVGEVAALGVDFISVGAITHSAPSADMSLLFDWDVPL